MEILGNALKNFKFWVRRDEWYAENLKKKLPLTNLCKSFELRTIWLLQLNAAHAS